MGSRIHETYDRGEAPRAGGDRAFGFVFAVVLLVLGLLPLRHGGPVRTGVLAAAALILLAALLRPSLLHGPNLLWMKAGGVLHRIVNPVVTAAIFYGVFTPSGMLLRLSGKDPLRLKYDPAAGSYWLPRQPPGPGGRTMSNQY